MGRDRIEIAGRAIGRGEKVFIVAEVSANHNRSFDRAVEIIRAVQDAGADAVKLQTYTPDTLTLDSGLEPFRIGAGTLWEGRTLHDLYSEAYTPWEWQPRLKDVADELGLVLFSSPFDPTAVDFLEEMRVPAYKVASFELVDLPLIRKIAATGKPMILSTGMATLGEIEEAVSAARGAGATELALLKCTSAYPAPPEEADLRTIPHLAETFGVPAGLSDHTLGIEVAVASVALGACIIEKHFTLSRDEPGPDSAFSLEPEELRRLVESVRIVEKALGGIRYEPTGTERPSRVFRRSLFAVENIAEGEVLTPRNVRSIRPGHGLHPRHLEEILGGVATRDIPRGTPLSWSLVRGARQDGNTG